HMDGVHALQYVRSRHGDVRGDFARSERQQQLLLAIKAQASHVNVADLPSLASAFNGEIKTSMGLDRMRAMLSIANDFSGPNVHPPTAVSAPARPGTMYVAQAGAIYRFQHGAFRQITDESGWMQPSAAPDGRLVAVSRQPNFSDLYLLDGNGKVVSQLSHNSSTRAVEDNHWTFYPRFSPDGQSLFYDLDPKDSFNSFRVDLAIFASQMTTGGRAHIWTSPNEFTGGDVQPVPLRDGSLIYTKYSIDDSYQVHSQVWIQRRPGTPGVALTTPEAGCGQPAVSPDEKLIAMVCTRGSSTAGELDVAS